jgi:signal transduction histidine kinase
LQIVLALGALMVFAFVPLYFAVASLARATLRGTAEQSARALASSIAVHAGEASALGQVQVEQALGAQLDRLKKDGVVAACFVARAPQATACAGSPSEVGAINLRSAEVPETAAVEVREGELGPILQVVSPTDRGTLVARVRFGDATTRANPLVRLVALYMTTFALALIVFAYFALTRLLVRPLDDLVRAADRVASGARSMRVPRSGPREVAELATSMQAMAERLIAEEATLQLKVDELTETTTRLTQAQAQLVRSERLASVGRLAAGLAHEIGNPIAAITGMQDLLLDGDLPPETQRDFLERMRRETERIHGVLRDLLDFARPEKEGGAPGAQTATGDVRAVLDDVTSLVRPQKVFRSVQVTVDAEDVPLVALGASQLTQVLLNVVMNAGAAIASMEKGEGAVRIRVRRGDKHVRIAVEDDGPGVSPEVRDHLFEPFATTKPVGEGTGLGLAVCRGLVEAAGGTIEMDPGYSDGARFVIELPIAAVL